MRVDFLMTTYCEILGKRLIPASNDKTGQTSADADQGKTESHLTSVLSSMNETFFMYTHTVIIYMI